MPNNRSVFTAVADIGVDHYVAQAIPIAPQATATVRYTPSAHGDGTISITLVDLIPGKQTEIITRDMTRVQQLIDTLQAAINLNENNKKDRSTP